MHHTQRYQALDYAPKRETLKGTEKYLRGSFYTLRIGLLCQLISVSGLILSYSLGVSQTTAIYTKYRFLSLSSLGRRDVQLCFNWIQR